LDEIINFLDIITDANKDKNGNFKLKNKKKNKSQDNDDVFSSTTLLNRSW
jgi:hypothetical protein